MKIFDASEVLKFVCKMYNNQSVFDWLTLYNGYTSMPEVSQNYKTFKKIVVLKNSLTKHVAVTLKTE